MAAPPLGPVPAGFTLYALVGEAGPANATVQPYGLGTACFSAPLSNGHPWRPPITVVNNLGFPFILGYPVIPLIPRAPVTIGPLSLRPGTYTIQGIIRDTSTGGYGARLSNAIVIEVQ